MDNMCQKDNGKYCNRDIKDLKDRDMDYFPRTMLSFCRKFRNELPSFNDVVHLERVKNFLNDVNSNEQYV